jgi:hypothetical protein
MLVPGYSSSCGVESDVCVIVIQQLNLETFANLNKELILNYEIVPCPVKKNH